MFPAAVKINIKANIVTDINFFIVIKRKNPRVRRVFSKREYLMGSSQKFQRFSDY